jgi:hypothetical protein
MKSQSELYWLSVRLQYSDRDATLRLVQRARGLASARNLSLISRFLKQEFGIIYSPELEVIRDMVGTRRRRR